ncbi:MAG: thiamine phosphate synthase [Acidobacteriia bacterium]|nr:thiamine phosphate synthase [Terriglobia bacterium]
MTDRTQLSDKEFLRRVAEVLEAGIDLIQLREKGTPTQELVGIAEQLMQIKRRPSQKILINDRLDVALGLNFDGIHLGQSSFPAAEVRKCVPKNFLVGVSTHHVAEAVQAEKAGADYVIFGPIFPTPSKLKYGLPQGTARLGEVVRALTIPVLAIGGISLANFEECLAMGCAGIAAISMFQGQNSIPDIIQRLHSYPSP